MDDIYIKQILSGDIGKFSYLMDKYKHMAYTLAYRILNNHEEAEEAVQDSFMKAYKALYSFRGESKFSTWLYKIVVNHANSKRKEKRQVDYFTDIDGIPDIAVEGIDYVYKRLIQQEQRHIINSAMDKLDPDDRLILTLYYLNENSMAEVAAIISVSADNVKMRIHRARKKLFLILDKLMQKEI